MPSSFLTGALIGTDRALGRRADLKLLDRQAQDEAAARQQELAFKLRMALAEQGVAGRGGPEELLTALQQHVAGQQKSKAEEADLAKRIEQEMFASKIPQPPGSDVSTDVLFRNPQLMGAFMRDASVREQKFSKDKAAEDARIESEDRELKRQKLEAEIKSTMALADKRGIEAFKASQSGQTGEDPKRIDSIYSGYVKELTRRKADLEDALSGDALFMTDEQRVQLESEVEQLSASGIDQLAREATTRQLRAVSELGGDPAPYTTQGSEGARQEVQGFRAAGASKEEAVQLLVQLGYDEATAREVTDEEY